MKIMKHIVAFCFILLLITSASGQIQDADSLINILNTQKLSDDDKIEILMDIGLLYMNYDYNQCIEYSEKGLLLAEKKGNNRRIATFSNLLGISYYYKLSFDTSYVYLNRFIEGAIKLNDNKLIAAAYGSMATMYKIKEDYSAAVDYYMKSLAFCDTLYTFRATTLSNLATLHRALGHLDRAEEYLIEALGIARKFNLDDAEMYASHALGIVYADKQEYDKTIELYKKSLEISRKINNIRYELVSNQSLAISYSKKNDPETALKYAFESLQIAEKTGDKLFISPAQLTLADIYRTLKRYKDCEEMASMSWTVDSTSINSGAYAALNLAISNMYIGNKQKAEEFILRYQDIVLKGNDKQMKESLASMEVKYETEKKEMRIASLEKERELYIWLAIAGILLVFIVGIVLQQKIKNEQRKGQLVAANAVQEGEMGERERLATELHDRLGGTLSAVKSELNNTKDLPGVSNKLDECIEEVRRITHNMMPLSLRFGIKAALEDFTAQFSNVHFHFFGKETTISKRLEFVIYCCANELVTNALKHSGADNVNLQLIQEENRIALMVQDDGCGFDEKSVKHGIGLKNIYDRVASCNGKIEIISSTGKGTEISMEFKPENI